MTRSFSTLALGILIGTISTVGVASATNHSQHMERLVEEARSELATLQALIPAARRNPGVLTTMERQADELEQTLISLDRTVDHLQTPPPPQAVSTAELRQIEQAVKRESFSDEQMVVLRSAVRGRHFTSAQVLRMMSLFDFDDDKVEAAVLLFPKVLDQHNWYTVYAGLTFGSDKAELRRRTM